jgi:hypothetical protein
MMQKAGLQLSFTQFGEKENNAKLPTKAPIKATSAVSVASSSSSL